MILLLLISVLLLLSFNSFTRGRLIINGKKIEKKTGETVFILNS